MILYRIIYYLNTAISTYNLNIIIKKYDLNTGISTYNLNTVIRLI